MNSRESFQILDLQSNMRGSPDVWESWRGRDRSLELYDEDVMRKLPFLKHMFHAGNKLVSTCNL